MHVCFVPLSHTCLYSVYVVLMTVHGGVSVKPLGGHDCHFHTLFIQSISINYTYSFKFPMFDLDVTFETKSPVDIKEALHGTF